MRRVLIVDDDLYILRGLRRMLRSMRHEWEIALASSGLAALEAIEQEPFDIVVSDMRMPGMDGAELLSKVRSLHPDSVRIILSGHSGRSSVIKSVAPAHQYLSKPCKPATLIETIERAYVLRDLLQSSELQGMVSQVDCLPSLPSLYQGLVDELRQQAPCLQKVTRIIAQDIGMSASILKLVSSAYFGVLKPVGSVERAVTHLGLETIKDLLRVPIFSEYTGPLPPGFSIETLWRHSLCTSAFARTIAEHEQCESELVEAAAQAAMLHDIGKLLLATSNPERYGSVLQHASSCGVQLSVAEKELLGATHAEIGAYLLGLWGLPQSIVEAVAYHARPAACPIKGFRALTVVHVANELACEVDQSEAGAFQRQIDSEYLIDLGLGDRLPAWRAACHGELSRVWQRNMQVVQDGLDQRAS